MKNFEGINLKKALVDFTRHQAQLDHFWGKWMVYFMSNGLCYMQLISILMEINRINWILKMISHEPARQIKYLHLNRMTLFRAVLNVLKFSTKESDVTFQPEFSKPLIFGLTYCIISFLGLNPKKLSRVFGFWRRPLCVNAV